MPTTYWTEDEVEQHSREVARRAAAAEREACAKIAANWLGSPALGRAMAKNSNAAEATMRIVRGEAEFIAEAIRKRSN